MTIIMKFIKIKIFVLFITIIPIIKSFILNSTNNAGLKWKKIHCNNEYDCQPFLLNSMCLNGHCDCIINHRFNTDNMKCELFFCKNDDECKLWDKNMICDYKKIDDNNNNNNDINHCKCSSNYQFNEIDQHCYKLSSNMSWFIIVSLIPLILIVLFCLNCFRLALTNTIPKTKPPSYHQ